MKEMADDRHEAWQIEQQINMRILDEQIPQAAWAAEFDPRQSSSSPLPTQTTNPHRPSFMTSVGINGQLMPMSMYGMNPPPGLYQGNYANNVVFEGKGKGKEREVDFEAAFAQAAASLSPAQTGTLTEDGVADVTNAMDNTCLQGGETEDGVEFRQ
jgi:peroxin-5